MTRLLLLLVLLLPGWAAAHSPSNAYLRLRTGDAFSGRLDIALRDLEQAIGLDGNGDRAITWGELRQRRSAVEAYLVARLRLTDAARQPCQLDLRDYRVADHSDGAYAVLLFDSDCRPAGLVYNLLFDVDPLHRGLLQVAGPSGTKAAVLGPDSREYAIGSPAPWRIMADYIGQGTWHVLIGFDHILFLLLLILPAVVGRRAASGFKANALELAKIVTAFTVAHSITLSLATLGLVSLPSRLVEAGIAASVVLTAAANLWRPLWGRRWTIAFGFGLLHGLGFASVLGDLGLPAGVLAAALLAFNAGVELGQLGILTLVLPLLLLACRLPRYRRLLLPCGSVAAGLVGLLWLLERLLLTY